MLECLGMYWMGKDRIVRRRINVIISECSQSGRRRNAAGRLRMNMVDEKMQQKCVSLRLLMWMRRMKNCSNTWPVCNQMNWIAKNSVSSNASKLYVNALNTSRIYVNGPCKQTTHILERNHKWRVYLPTYLPTQIWVPGYPYLGTWDPSKVARLR